MLQGPTTYSLPPSHQHDAKNISPKLLAKKASMDSTNTPVSTATTAKTKPESVSSTTTTTAPPETTTRTASKPRRWTQEEDSQLRAAVGRIGECSWKEIAKNVPGRSHVQCLQRWQQVLKPGLRKGHWSKDEDARLQKAIHDGVESWSQVSQIVNGRSAKQCRERWINHLSSQVRRDRWTPTEDHLLVELCRRFPGQWTLIANEFPGKSQATVREHWAKISAALNMSDANITGNVGRASFPQLNYSALSDANRLRAALGAAATGTSEHQNQFLNPLSRLFQLNNVHNQGLHTAGGLLGTSHLNPPPVAPPLTGLATSGIQLGNPFSDHAHQGNSPTIKREGSGGHPENLEEILLNYVANNGGNLAQQQQQFPELNLPASANSHHISGQPANHAMLMSALLLLQQQKLKQQQNDVMEQQRLKQAEERQQKQLEQLQHQRHLQQAVQVQLQHQLNQQLLLTLAGNNGESNAGVTPPQPQLPSAGIPSALKRSRSTMETVSGATTVESLNLTSSNASNPNHPEQLDQTEELVQAKKKTASPEAHVQQPNDACDLPPVKRRRDDDDDEDEQGSGDGGSRTRQSSATETKDSSSKETKNESTTSTTPCESTTNKASLGSPNQTFESELVGYTSSSEASVCTSFSSTNSPSWTPVPASPSVSGDDSSSTDSPQKPHDQKKRKSRVPVRWTHEEDEQLRKVIERTGECQWKFVASHVPGRNHVQCLQRWRKVLRPGIVKGQWTPEEDAILKRVAHHRMVKEKNWTWAAVQIPGRTAKQCRERWVNHLREDIKKSPWSEAEDEHLLRLQTKFGNRWALISRELQGRTENAVKVRCKSLLVNQQRLSQGKRSLVPHNSSGEQTAVQSLVELSC